MLTCPVCLKEIHEGNVFCPHCGIKIPTTNPPLSTWSKMKIYLVTVFLAPFGLYWFFKYFRESDSEKRKVAYIVLVITLVTLAFSVFSGMYVMKYYTNYINTMMLGGL
ncbi:hypothetical protein A3K34_01640 [candidate division WWE3 bacterium RIFOXYC1_FULL_40_10]|uniref:Zinc-ribbon domain-containing protein n=1 Tax=candidate division WWE3 bacterium RIFOXYA2_FULL_46_9 TaxID=1802636 RepID=A0A1F4W2H0_UNCKA|nr:MAG: hypothetical protein A3K58_01640 [candidate division WWE3 bacterium RIFOXYB1_FULL_40_22]OGC61568.1 MAG: hypothetical protein A3K37_01640 [candidate division WWE3 bacterium RIFOXYA1_FULL_40_11]OGC63614.1 MAG: hypothetical protein A2264_04580 [candidate division WWE3 bacterium RIFOXYA2_FULL_46_9]OGC64753.1 MAG: hypothetical protein A2326_01815 [candidate division WWE3 bacterium RIFOXYB2_FULL_41_6]OGC65951.1 MAG: hypothetical protein A3K34_01640 [candidate division WWE3 bacterium RIFOXYC1_